MVLSKWNKHVKATAKKFPKLSFKEVLKKAKKTYVKSKKQIMKYLISIWDEDWELKHLHFNNDFEVEQFALDFARKNNLNKKVSIEKKYMLFRKCDTNVGRLDRKNK